MHDNTKKGKLLENDDQGDDQVDDELPVCTDAILSHHFAKHCGTLQHGTSN